MKKQSLSRDIVDNLIQMMSIAVQNSCKSESGIQNINGSLRYYSGCEFNFFNGVFNNSKNADGIIHDDLKEISAFFEVKKIPFILWWTQDSEVPPQIKTQLDALNFTFLGEFLGIACSLDEVKYAPIDDKVEVGIVTTEKEYQWFLDVMCEVFQLSESIKADIKDMYRSYGPKGKFKHYIGYYEGKPVATLTSYIDKQILGLYNGATMVSHQKNGLCTALAQHAITEARKLNCQYAVSQLISPGMAKGLSETLGAKTYCLLLPYLKNPS